MVNMPINVSAFPMDELGIITDINENINQEYYEWLLKQHNYFPEFAFHKERFEDTIKMEHSYTRDWKQTVGSDILTTRTILMERPPLCPSCHQLSPNHDEKVDTPEAYNIPIPPYNEEAGRKTLNATEEMIKSCHNRNSDTDDWTQFIQKFNWTDQQQSLFERVERLLDMDQLGRMAVTGLPNECLRRNAIIEKSVTRMRATLGSVQWEPRLTSWLHALLMTHLPPKYMVSYIDILQALKRKVPTLVDKMFYHKPIEMHKDYLSAIMKQPWEPSMVEKTRKLPNNPIIVVISTNLCSGNTSSRERRWLELLGTLASIESITANQVKDHQEPIEQVTEQLVAMTRSKIQHIRNQTANRDIILAGFNAGAAIALQVALVETVNSIICFGFAFNTLHGVRGFQDDRILDLTIPVLFVIGQNAQRSSQEEIESLREKMCAQTMLVVVGSSDDSLRVKRLNRSMEGISQSMIDNMIMDEIQKFATNCITNPPGPRKTHYLNGCRKVTKQRAQPLENDLTLKRYRLNSAQHFKANAQHKSIVKVNNNTNKIHKPQNCFDNASLDVTIDKAVSNDIIQNGNNYEDSQSIKRKVKYIPQNQFVHIKPPPINTQKIYVKKQNGNASYTLGVKNIGKIETTQSNLQTVKNKNHLVGQLAIPKNNTELQTKSTTIVADTSLKNIDIFDIPILFADNDDNTIDDNQTHSLLQETIKTNDTNDINSIDVISEEIVDDAIEEAVVSVSKDDKSISDHEVLEKETITTKPASKTKNNFVVLNKNALSRLKTVKHLPTLRFKKVFNSRSNIRISASGRLGSIDSKAPRTISAMKFRNLTHIYPSENRDIQQLPMDSDPQKSGILIKRNHIKNLTVRQINVVQSNVGNKNKLQK